MIYWWFLVILVTAFVTMLAAAALTGRQPRVPLDRLADPAPLPGELPRAGLLPLGHLPETGPSGPWLEPEPFDLCEALLREGHMPGRLFELNGPYGPFPVDTGPLLILSEQAAARADLEREIPRLCAEAEAKIPPRWRS